MIKDWHLIIDRTPQKGSWNMAVDDYLFQSLGEEALTYLRFYQWDKPTVSIGRSQKAEKVVNLDFCRRNGIDIVRRITGGKLVLHHKEVTYTVCSSDTEIFSHQQMKNNIMDLMDFDGISGLTSFDFEGNPNKIPFILTIKKGKIQEIE